MTFNTVKPLTKQRLKLILDMIKKHPMSANMVGEAMNFSNVAANNYLKMLHKNNLIHIKKWVQTNNGSPAPHYGFGHLPDAPKTRDPRPYKVQKADFIAARVTQTTPRTCDPLVAAFFHGVHA